MQKKYFLLFLITLNTLVLGYNFNDLMVKQEVSLERFQGKGRMVVSLGPHCGIASRLAEYRIRFASFPFDWISSDFEGIYDLFKSDFMDFLNPLNLSVRDCDGVVFDRKFGFYFNHDFKLGDWKIVEENGMLLLDESSYDIYDQGCQKYARRIVRLCTLLEAGKPLYLIRINMKKEEAFRLYDLLKNKFPRSDCILVSLQVKPNGKDENWGKDGVLHFSIGRDGKMHPAGVDVSSDYERVFKILKLL